MLYLLVFLPLVHNAVGDMQLLTNTIHQTSAAKEQRKDMYCYSCQSMEDGGAMCVDNITANLSTFMRKCGDSEHQCLVRRYSYTTSTENATSEARMWSLERRCTRDCEPGCIMIGERTKIYACTSCCNTSYCNWGRGSGAARLSAIGGGGRGGSDFDRVFGWMMVLVPVVAMLVMTDMFDAPSGMNSGYSSSTSSASEIETEMQPAKKYLCRICVSGLALAES